MNKLKLIVVAVIVGIIGVLFLQNKNLKKENSRVSDNAEQLSTLLGDTQNTLKVNDSISATKIISLNLKASEMAKNAIIDKDIIDDLNIKIKQIRSYGHTEAVTVYNDTILLKDTIMFLDSRRTVAKVFQVDDEWYNIKGRIDSVDIILEVVSREELEYIEHWSKRKFLFIPIGKKRDSQIILSKNPNTKITKSVFITNIKRMK